MLKNKLWLGIILSILLLVFSMPGFTSYYKYTQESGANFYVGTADKSDALEDTNEMRQIIDDLGALLVHSKRNDLYPKDETTGGTIQIPETGLKFSNVPVNDDIAAYIAGEMTWQTKAELSIQPLDTALTNISALAYVSPSLIKLTATDTYVVRTLAEIKEDLSLNYVENLKVKLDGTQAPTVNNDTDEGYVVGSRWFDVTNDKEYVCLDNTDGAAVWTETTGAGGGASTFLGLTDTPAAYTDQAGKYVKVNVGEDALEFGTPAGGGTVTTSGTPVANDIARFTDATTIEGRSYSELKTDLAYQLSDMSDVGSTTPTDKYVLVADGDSWESRAISSNDLSDVASIAMLDENEIVTGNWEFSTANIEQLFNKTVQVTIQKDGDDIIAIYKDVGIISRHDEAGQVLQDVNDYFSTNSVLCKITILDRELPIETSVDFTVNGLVLQGTGLVGPATLVATGSITTQIIRVQSFLVIIKDLDINGQSKTIDGIRVYHPVFNSIENVKVHNCVGTGIYITGEYVGGGGGGTTMFLSKMYSEENTDGIVLEGGIKGVSLRDSVSEKNTNSNLKIDDAKAVILDNFWQEHGDVYGVYVSNVEGLEIIGGFTYHNGSQPAWYFGSDVASPVIFRSHRHEDGAAHKAFFDNDSSYPIILDNTYPANTNHTGLYNTINNYTNILASDHTYSGELDSQPVGETVAFGEILYFNWTDKEWKKAIASAYTTARGTRIALESKTDGQTCLMLVKGYIRDDSAFDFGAVPIFLNDDVAGTCDDTAPAESGDQIFVVGEAKSADILFFDPGKDVGEI